MTEARKKSSALRFRELLDAGVPRKKALLQVRDEIRAVDPDLPNSRTSIYAWCKKWGVSTR
ncbi:MAG: hypothetical protein PHS14_07710 [Elusimicrobia bacterium]|nr:hypothetical protein [Elusimicrobiota bacterium]